MQKGFTLIELLVVIAIIGILAGMVVVGMPQALNKAADATIKNAVAQFKTQAELYRDEHSGSYTGLTMTITTPISKINNELVKNSAAPSIGISTDGLNYCIRAKLRSADNTYYCQDNQGNSTTTVSASTPTWCATDQATCP